jgi:hypothetical protein
MPRVLGNVAGFRQDETRVFEWSFSGNAFTAQPVKATEDHLTPMEWSEP